MSGRIKGPQEVHGYKFILELTCSVESVFAEFSCLLAHSEKVDRWVNPRLDFFFFAGWCNEKTNNVGYLGIDKDVVEMINHESRLIENVNEESARLIDWEKLEW